MEENQNPEVPKTKREQFSERLKKKYPEKEYADDEELFGQIGDDYDAYDKELEGYKERESKLADMLENSPQGRNMVLDIAEGKDPIVAMLERVGIDGITDLLNDPEKQKMYAEANQQFIERLAKEKEAEETYQKNIAESIEAINKFQEERGISDDMMDAAGSLITKIASDALIGKFSPETFEMALRAVSHDADVENARTEGSIAGRNSKIEEKLRKPTTGDGTPTLAGSNNAPTRKASSMSMFDLADEAK